jgi:hypothetical protein
MPKYIRRGSGITQKTFIAWNFPEDLDEAGKHAEGRNPLIDFDAWLDRFKNEIDDHADALGVKAQFGKKSWPYQSQEWYLSQLRLACFLLEQALTSGNHKKIAARGIMLGDLRKEYRLKFSGERKLTRFEDASRKQMTALDQLNDKKRVEAKEWQRIADEVLDGLAAGIRGYPEAARQLLAHWPKDVRKPGLEALRKYLPHSPKRARIWVSQRKL